MLQTRFGANVVLLARSRCLNDPCALYSVSTTVWSSSLRSLSVQSARWRPAKARNGGRHGPPRPCTHDGQDVPQLAGEGVYGIHSVLQVLTSGHRDTYALYVQETRFLSDRQSSITKNGAERRTLARINELATRNQVAIYPTSKWMLNHITGDKPHQVRATGGSQTNWSDFVLMSMILLLWWRELCWMRLCFN